MRQTIPVFEERFVIRQYEVAADNRLRLESLANFLEEAAGNHAEQLGVGIDALLSEGMTWILVKMRIVINELPEAGTSVVLHTWPCAYDRGLFRRDFELSDESGGMLAASVQTKWALFDIAERRMATELPDAAMRFAALVANGLRGEDIRIPSIRKGIRGNDFAVRLDDIDKNDHVNNVRYLSYTLEAAHALVPTRQRLRQIDIVYRTESRYGDILHALSLPVVTGDETCLIHSIRRDDTEVTRARTVWK